MNYFEFDISLKHFLWIMAGLVGLFLLVKAALKSK